MKGHFMHVFFLNLNAKGNLVSKLQPIKMSHLWKGAYRCTGFLGEIYLWMHWGTQDVNG